MKIRICRWHSGPRPWTIFVAGLLLAALCTPAWPLTSAAQPADNGRDGASFVDKGDEDRQVNKILVLNSYHPGYSWSDETLAGIREELESSFLLENIHVEYMDGKRQKNPEYEKLLSDLYRHKYGHIKLDVVVTLDDTALGFALRHQESLFNDSPIVFAGVSSFDKAEKSGRGITGVLHAIDAKATVDLALRLRPRTKDLYFLLDSSETSETWRPLLEAACNGRPGLAVHWLEGREFSTEELLAKITAIPADATIIAGVWSSGRLGRFVAVDEISRAIYAHAKAPVFALSSPWIASGAVGGKVPNARRHGIKAGNLVRRILGGTPAEDIPIHTDGTNQFVFNYDLIAAFGIEPKDLPPESRLLNPPAPSLYQEHPAAFLAATSAIVVLSVLVLVLIAVLRRLREREGHFQSLFTNNKSAILILRPEDGAIHDANQAAVDFYGWTREEMTSKKIQEINILPPDAIKTSMAQSFNEESNHFFFQHRLADGTVRDVEIFTGPFFSGKKRLLCSIIQDITDRKRSEEMLKASELRYRQLFEANPHPMWMFDLQTLAFLAVNDSAVAHYGYSEEEFLGMTIKDIRPPEEVPILFDCLSRISSGVDHFLTRHRCKDGRIISVELSAHDIDFDDRRARVVAALDVTEKRRAEERMRLDAAALRSTRDAVLIADRTPSILSVNPAFTEITGYSEKEIVGKNPHILRSGPYRDSFSQDILSGLARDGHWQGEVWGRRKRGEAFLGRLAISTVQNAGGEPTHFVGVVTDLTSLRRNEKQLEYLANYDPLTNLPNRQLFESVLQHSMERAQREKNRLGLLIINLDQFKAINESFGHHVGDELLAAFVKRLRERLRGEDTLARLAGDQFALVLQKLNDYSDAQIVARDLHSTIEAHFILEKKIQVIVRASIGIGFFPQDGDTAQDLLRATNAAVNLAKERGGNQSCYCSSELNTQARANLELQFDLRQALERQEFILHYQPKVDLRSGRIAGAEALLRWNSPKRGLVPPLQFIPAAEKNGLIVPIGQWVIREVCRQMREWRNAGLTDIDVSLNVSARQFRSAKLESFIRTALEQNSIDPRRLVLELTESMLMDHPEDAVARMAELKRIGVRLSLDDFGTGYSSLSYLSRFPVDNLKIDRSFITNINTDPRASTIATSIIAMAHRMRLKVVAEGVETEAQLGTLAQNGCDEIQGYYFSRPVPAQDFADLMRMGKTLAVPETGTESSFITFSK